MVVVVIPTQINTLLTSLLNEHNLPTSYTEWIFLKLTKISTILAQSLQVF
jgi:hypothetical protein